MFFRSALSMRAGARKTPLALGLAGWALAGCATGVSYDECAGADWFEFGRKDGLEGAEAKAFEKRADQCADLGVVADLDAYAAGRREGLAVYCTPESGFRAGRQDQKYDDVCPPALEDAFLAAFEDGRRLYRMTRDHERAVTAYRNAVESLARHKTDLRRAVTRYEDPYLSGADRFVARQDVEYHEREIDRLERDIPKMDAEIRASREALDAYKAALRAEGRVD